MTVELKCLAPRPMASLRLLCFPFAGAGTAVFRNWADLLPRHVEPWAVQLPAREDRLREAAYNAWPALHAGLVSAFNRLPAQPTALFGHSMGAVMAFELARYLQASGKPAPKHLFVSGRAWPGTGLPQDHGIDLRDDAGLLAMMEGRYGSLPASMAHPEIREMAVETLRSDLRLLDSYQYRPGLPLDCPITALTGDSDPTTRGGLADAWRTESSVGFSSEAFAGGHFFLESQRQNVLSLISDRLARG